MKRAAVKSPKLKDMPALNRLLRLASERVLPLMFMFRTHLRLLSVLRGSGNIEILRRYPKIRYKYLLNNYLFEELSRTGAAEAMIEHYSTLAKYTDSAFMAEIFESKIRLWLLLKGENEFTISLAFPRDFRRSIHMYDHEGELSLMFEMNGQLLYSVTFSIVPGAVLNKGKTECCPKQVIFVGRIQGVRGEESAMRSATKELMENAPARLLLIAVEAVAQFFDIKFIAGVSESQQLSRSSIGEAENFFGYDEFWKSFGAEPFGNGLYIVPSPTPEKPIEQITQKHRGRTLKKRQFRNEIRKDIVANLEARLL